MTKPKMRNAKRIPYLVLVIGMALLLISCSSPQKRIVGKWEDPKSGETWQFFKDGTVTMHYMEQAPINPYTGKPWWPPIPTTINGTYSCPDKNHLKITVEGFLGGSAIFKVSISRNELILTDPETGEFTKYQRVK